MKKLFKDIKLWETIQRNHEEVVRWGTFLANDNTLRPQNNLHHIVSVIHVATWICAELENLVDFNSGLVLSSFNIHEHGEALTKNDTVYSEKKDDASDDVKEYQYVINRFKTIYKGNNTLFKKMKRIFLLQFVTQEHKWKDFPLEAQKHLQWLKNNHLIEAQIFNAIERYEYFYYCFEKQAIKNKSLLLNVLENQVKYLNRYASDDGIPGFNRIWTKNHIYETNKILALI